MSGFSNQNNFMIYDPIFSQATPDQPLLLPPVPNPQHPPDPRSPQPCRALGSRDAAPGVSPAPHNLGVPGEEQVGVRTHRAAMGILRPATPRTQHQHRLPSSAHKPRRVPPMSPQQDTHPSGTSAPPRRRLETGALGSEVAFSSSYILTMIITMNRVLPSCNCRHLYSVCLESLLALCAPFI